MFENLKKINLFLNIYIFGNFLNKKIQYIHIYLRIKTYQLYIYFFGFPGIIPIT